MKPAIARIRRSTLIMIGVWIAVLALFVLVRPAPPETGSQLPKFPVWTTPTSVQKDPPRTTTPATQAPTTTSAPAATTTPAG